MGRNSRGRAKAKAVKRPPKRPPIGGGHPTPAASVSSPAESPRRSMPQGFALPPSGEDITYWARLREMFLATYPACPDCGAPWDLESAGQEHGPIHDAVVYSLHAPCWAFQDDEDAGREPARHVRTDGLLTFNIAVRDGQISVHDEAP